MIIIYIDKRERMGERDDVDKHRHERERVGERRRW